MGSKLAVLVVLLCAPGCAPAPERLRLEGRTITVHNDSGETWKAIEVWVNDHYRVTRDEMAADERFVVPLESFVAGFGQRFPRDQQVKGIEVTATDESGDAVQLTWGSGRRR
jgi:hypothetical protein